MLDHFLKGEDVAREKQNR